jgi:hypothetical protein
MHDVVPPLVVRADLQFDACHLFGVHPVYLFLEEQYSSNGQTSPETLVKGGIEALEGGELKLQSK